MSVTTLQPINPPIAVFGRHVEPEVTTMVVLDEIFEAGDDYVVRDQKGATIIRANAMEWSTLDKKVVYDDFKKPICELKDKVLALHRTVEAVTPAGHVLLKVERQSGSSTNRLFRAKFGYHKLELDVVGDWKDHRADIVLTSNILVAKTYRDAANFSEVAGVISLGEGTGGVSMENQYVVQVAPGVDLAIIAILCICLDMLHRQGTQ